MRTNHEIDYRIFGEEMQCVEIELDPQETVVAESGAFMYMDDGVQMETVFGDGSQQSGGFFSKIVGAGKRLLTGESLFMTTFTHRGLGKAKVAFASPYPGKIIALDLQQMNGKIVCQKDAFLCAAKGVSIGIEFQRKLGTGLFGGEGFIMQKIEGDGMAFCHAGGHIMKRDLQPGEVLKIDTICRGSKKHTLRWRRILLRNVARTRHGMAANASYFTPCFAYLVICRCRWT